MTPGDLAALHAGCFETPRPWSEVEFAALLASPGCFLCTVPDGFALGRVLAGEAELLTLAVAPQARRSGQGRRLLGTFETAAREQGADRAFLEVSAANGPAIALYLSQGYSEAGRRKDYYRTPTGTRIDALVLTRPLA
ncbi:GNAT family N-acetyltransferase [Tropicimonas sp. IMCC6043]|uniref:GNAT family N-acetyltransferase n=1 Tax=Tropicimonas sp. IMCC6043 TaxID=2510645 RepID=UPI00101B5E32|nr:GNAT family N-acetyltransferase [Tropicimonas sp. IMCC6043]RYH09469.1 GNAT family N-acetyltransferase [Tropicimonas sp. IMCC6043]